MNTMFNPAPGFLIPVLALFAAIPSGNAEVVSTTRDGITIAAGVSFAANGKTHIYCSLTNQSAYPLVSMDTHSSGGRFKFKLLDSTGNYVAQENKWAEDHSQEDETGSEREYRGGYTGVKVEPSKKYEFEFDLEDAYGERVAQGRTMEIKWKNIYSGPETHIDIPEMKGADGKVIPAHRDLVHFPGLWTVSVSVPLPKRGVVGQSWL